ncbi:hypothetical protein DXG01_007060 [Tephrocybe rancida]|nr:hypothetical protein DXG01_007060 [Tephrocybe rancida]
MLETSVSAAPTAAGIAAATSDTGLLINVPSQQANSSGQGIATRDSDGDVACNIDLGKREVVDNAQAGDDLGVTDTAIDGNGRHARAALLDLGLDGDVDLKLSRHRHRRSQTPDSRERIKGEACALSPIVVNTSFAPAANDATFEDVSQGWNSGDYDPSPFGLGHLPLKRHPSQELESLRPPKLSRVASDIFLLNKAPSPTISIEPVDSADRFLGDFIASVLTYASVKQPHDHATPQTADRAATLCGSFLIVFRDPTQCEHLLDYRGEHVQALIDTMQSLLDDGHVERKLRLVFIRVIAELSFQSHLYPRRFFLQNVTDQGVKVTAYSGNSTKGFMEGKVVCIKSTPASDDSDPNFEEEFHGMMLWAQLSHENVLPFYGIYTIGDNPLPRLISPFLENGKILDFLDRNPDSDRRSFACDIAAGMSYLHDNGLIHSGIDYILVTTAAPPRACLAYPSFGLGDMLGPHSFQDMVFEPDGLDETDSDEVAGGFFDITVHILAHELIDYYLEYDNIESDIFTQGYYPLGGLYDGLDKSMWCLLRDCHKEELDQRPTARQIVDRLQDGKEQWEMALAAQKHETDSIIKSVMTYVSLKQDPHKITQACGATQASVLYDSFRNMFQDFRRYECLINCRGEGAQALIESIQSVCDVAAGMSYLHDNGLIHGNLHFYNIGVTSAVPPRACLIALYGMHFEPTRLLPGEFWSDETKKKMSEMHLGTTYYCPTQAGDVYDFSVAAFQILTGQEYQASCAILQERLGTPVGYLDRGFNDLMWQLLLDCRSRYLDVRPTAHQIVEWLLHPEAREKQTRLRIAKKREHVERFLSATCTSVQHYKNLLSCDGDDAQILLDTFQLLLDTGAFEDRTQLVAAIKRLSGPAKRFPRRFFLGPVPAITANPVASGGFADVYKVDFQGEATCFKVIRFYDQSQVEHMAKVSICKRGYCLGSVVASTLSMDLHILQRDYLLLPAGQHRVTLLNISGKTLVQMEYFSYALPSGDLLCLAIMTSEPSYQCKDTAAGVGYLHMNDIVHGDLKGCNVLIDSSGRASLCDFGLASVTDPKIIKWTSQSTMASKGGTARWQAPELHESEDTAEEVYNTKATDIFAWAGIFTGRLPFFEIPRPITIMSKIVQGHIPTRPEHENAAWRERGLNERIWNLMKECWHFEPSKRPDMTQVLSKLAVENVIDNRPPGEWEKDASMRFRNSQDLKESDNVNSMLFWEDLEDLLLRLVPDLDSDIETDSEVSI